jgi:hypothetical protein
MAINIFERKITRLLLVIVPIIAILILPNSQDPIVTITTLVIIITAACVNIASTIHWIKGGK